MRTLALVMFTILTACATDPTHNPANQGQIWTCHTRASCDGITEITDVPRCFPAHKLDQDQVGETEAQYWQVSWRSACDADQGTPSDLTHAHLCVLPGTYDEAPWSCDVECETAGEPCDLPAE
jgi:hypothetical protein